MRHVSCDTLPLEVFISCVCDNDYTGMGGASSDDNLFLWNACYEQYIVLRNQEDVGYNVMLCMEIEKMKYRYLSIQRGLELLRSICDMDIIHMLEREGFYYKFDPSDRESYFTDIHNAEKKSSRILFDIREKSTILSSIGDASTSEKITRDWFDREMAALSKNYGFRINKKDITVSEYVAYINVSIAELKKKSENGRVNNGPD